MSIENIIKNKTVWVGGIEVNDYYLTQSEAELFFNCGVVWLN